MRAGSVPIRKRGTCNPALRNGLSQSGEVDRDQRQRGVGWEHRRRPLFSRQPASMYTISRRESFSDTTFLWDVMAPDVARSAEPGHFVMLRLHEGSERIPLTVADYDREAGTVTLVVQALGKTTVEMRDRYKEGDT